MKHQFQECSIGPEPERYPRNRKQKGVKLWLVVTGCHEFYFPINIGFMSSSQLTKSYFSEGWPAPTNQNWLKPNRQMTWRGRGCAGSRAWLRPRPSEQTALREEPHRLLLSGSGNTCFLHKKDSTVYWKIWVRYVSFKTTNDSMIFYDGMWSKMEPIVLDGTDQPSACAWPGQHRGTFTKRKLAANRHGDLANMDIYQKWLSVNRHRGFSLSQLYYAKK